MVTWQFVHVCMHVCVRVCMFVSVRACAHGRVSVCKERGEGEVRGVPWSGFNLL